MRPGKASPYCEPCGTSRCSRGTVHIFEATPHVDSHLPHPALQDPILKASKRRDVRDFVLDVRDTFEVKENWSGACRCG